MNSYEKLIFDSVCPYTNELCHKDIDCVDCEVNIREAELSEEYDKSEWEEINNK